MVEAREWSEKVAPLLKTLFGKSSRVALSLWILERDSRAFFFGEAQVALASFAIASSSVSQDLQVFVDAQMLIKTPSNGRVYFAVSDSALWQAFASIGDATEARHMFSGEVSAPHEHLRQKP
jgi:hypothetical protein